jgi:hypothetical protein
MAGDLGRVSHEQKTPRSNATIAANAGQFLHCTVKTVLLVQAIQCRGEFAVLCLGSVRALA